MHYEHKLILASCLMMIVSSLLFISQEMKAQQNSAAVSATVLPTPENTRINRKSFFENLTTYQKISLGTGAAFALSLGVAGYLFSTMGKKAHS